MSAGPRRAALAVKRAIDIFGSLAALVVLAPLLAVVAAAVYVTMGPPVLFRQGRPGRGGRLFLLCKFRTMADTAAGPSPTPLGAWLRAWSLDELPELFSVLKGDMSLVGPRPLLPEYLAVYTPVEARRHEMRPGVTGLAQVAGRNARSWDERLALDVWYVDHWSLGLDLRILARTVGKVLRREGINAPGRSCGAPRLTEQRLGGGGGAP